MRNSLLIILLTLGAVISMLDASAQERVRIVSAVKKSYNGLDIRCAGHKDAEITVTASGGSGTYQYTADNRHWQDSPVLSNLAPGKNAEIRVRDKYDQQNVSNVEYVWIHHANPVKINTFQQNTWYNDGNALRCFGDSDGELLVNADGGTNSFRYSIDDGETWQEDPIFRNLSAGVYEAMAQDQNGCVVKAPKKVTLKQPKPIEVVIVDERMADPGQNNGYIKVKGKGGQGGYNIFLDGVGYSKWNNGDLWLANNDIALFDNLESKEYKIQVADVHHSGWTCWSDHTPIVLNPIHASLSGEEALCGSTVANFTIEITASEANSYTVQMRDEEGNVRRFTKLKKGINIIQIGDIRESKSYALFDVQDEKGRVGVATGTATVQVKTTNEWLGKSVKWEDKKNWGCGIVPNLEQDAFIGKTSSDPLITGEANSVKTLTITEGATVTVRGTLTVAGELKTKGRLDATAGTIELAGTRAQTIYATAFLDRSVENLIISNANGVSVAGETTDTLIILNSLQFGTPDARFHTGDRVTLKSTRTRTASLGVVGAENIVTGKFTVEKYINLGRDLSLKQHGKAWMHLATPTRGQSIRDSWQEGAISTGKTPIVNPNPGYGTLLTTGHKDVPRNGFDLYTAPGPSIKTYVPETDSYDRGPLSTNAELYNPNGYLILVRGDRSVYTYNGEPVSTILRSTGEVITGATEPVTVLPGKFQSVGNPYPAKVYLRKMQKENVTEFFYVYDPAGVGKLGLGVWRTIMSDGLGGFISMLFGEPVETIESGQAFFVFGMPTFFGTPRPGKIWFTEDAKIAPGGRSSWRGQPGEKARELRSKLLLDSGDDSILLDGSLIQIHEDYDNGLDELDAPKMYNDGENFFMESAGQALVVERRKPLGESDTIHFRIGGLKPNTYRLELNASNFVSDSVQAWIEDRFAGTLNAVAGDGVTAISFTVTNAAESKSANRFRMVFKTMKVLPVTVRKVTATAKNLQIVVDWTVENQRGVHRYEVERSHDGKFFTQVGQVNAGSESAAKYSWTDREKIQGYAYYRIVGVDRDGHRSFSEVVRVHSGTEPVEIQIYPVPATDARVYVDFRNQAPGLYYYRLTNAVGQVVLNGKAVVQTGNEKQEISWNRQMARGTYQLQLTTPSGDVIQFPVVY